MLTARMPRTAWTNSSAARPTATPTTPTRRCARSCGR